MTPYYPPLPDDRRFDGFILLGDRSKVCIAARTIPRFKTSGLSGDEWRVSAQLQCSLATRDKPWIFGHVALAATYAPRLLDEVTSLAELGRESTWLAVMQKDHAVLAREYRSIAHALHDLPWIAAVTGEAEDWVVHPARDRLCGQPGCSAEATVHYRIKAEYVNGRIVPGFDPTTSRRAFCGRHSTRGDSDYNDCDENYEKLSGVVVAPRPEDITKARRMEVKVEGPDDLPAVLDAVRRVVRGTQGDA